MNKKVQELLKQLEDRIAQIDRAELMGLLMARTKHHHSYSINNMLIAGMQLCRQQNRGFCFEVFVDLWLAPFPVWNKWGYRINRGAKALDILTPIKYKCETKKTEAVPNVEIVENNHRVFFVTRPVFDISQTEKPVKNDNMVHRRATIGTATLSFSELLSKVHAARIKVEFLPLKEDTGGHIIGNTITINANNNTEAQYGTLLHELGHYCLGHTIAKGIHDRSVEELEAEATAFVIGKMLGVEIPSEWYVAAWTENGNAIRRSLSRIDAAVKKMVAILGISTELEVKHA